MYSLTIHFGPNAVMWSLLFKDETEAGSVYNAFVDARNEVDSKTILLGSDDSGQSFAIPAEQINGVLLEDLDLVEEARILRSLANARGEVKARQRASTDPVIRTAQQGPAVLQPGFGRG